MEKIQIIGAGLAGLSAAVTLAKHGISCNLISLQPSERAQSVMAEGGINGALDTMGESDTPQEHFADTMRAGCYLADEEAVKGLTEHAPEILKMLRSLGVPFASRDGVLQLRNFGGQKKKRTAYTKSSTGKTIMTSLIREVRKYESAGLVERYPHHEFLSLIVDRNGSCAGACIRDAYTGEIRNLGGIVLLACGGMNGLLPGITTGSTCNTSDAAAQVFVQGITLGNLEMIQYHPTTIGIAGKRCLVSEAARGEGGRLFILRNGQPWYFMEEKYPELGNLMPRDVVTREMYFVCRDPSCESQVYLDMRGIPQEVLRTRLPDLCAEIRRYTGIDPAKTPVPVEAGIHYFMGGILTDVNHRTSMKGVYAAGECCCQYHGANRLGGNSMLGAIYGGMTAAEDIAAGGETGQARLAGVQNCGDTAAESADGRVYRNGTGKGGDIAAGDAGGQACRDNRIKCRDNITAGGADFEGAHKKTESEQTSADIPTEPVRPEIAEKIGSLLKKSLGIVRNEEGLKNALIELEELKNNRQLNLREKNRLALAEAILESARYRRESRGAHYREDYPKTEEALCKMTVAKYKGGEKPCISVAYSEK